MGALYTGVTEKDFGNQPESPNLVHIIMAMLLSPNEPKQTDASVLHKEAEETSEKGQGHSESQTADEGLQRPEESTDAEPVIHPTAPPSETPDRKRIRRPINFLKPPHSRWLLALFAIVLVLIAVILFKPFAPIKSADTTVTLQPTGDKLPADPNQVTLNDSQMQGIKLAVASLQPFHEEKTATGKIGFNEDAMTPVFSPYTGRITRLFAKPGDQVTKGMPLFELETTDLVQAENDLIAANLALAKAHNSLELARRAEERQHILYANKAAALRDWEQAEADLRAAERDVHAQETTLAANRDRLRTFGKSDAEIAKIENERQLDRATKIVSPISGTITARKVGFGQYVKPDTPDPLFTIADLTSVWLMADVYEADIPLVRLGQPVEVRVNAFPNEVFTARVAYIGAALVPTTHRIAVRSVIENHHQKLKPDMFASFHITTNSQTTTLAVPTTAIVLDGEKTTVWVADKQNQFIRREVTTGLEQNGYRQILSGLQPGDRVVSEGSLLLTSVAMS